MTYRGRKYRNISGLMIQKGDYVFDGEKMSKVSDGSIGLYAMIPCFYRLVKHRKKK